MVFMVFMAGQLRRLEMLMGTMIDGLSSIAYVTRFISLFLNSWNPQPQGHHQQLPYSSPTL